MTRPNDAMVLVVGATGTVGGEAVRALRAQGTRVRALVRSPARAQGLPGVELVHGDLRDEASIRRALTGVSSAVFVAPHEPDEEEIAARFIRACEELGVRLVFIGVHIDAPTWLGRALRRMIFGRLAPHYRPKFRIGERARTCKADPIVVMPTNFFQNDEMFRDELTDGAFTQPFERGINRVDVRDLGVAIARAATDRTLKSGAYPVVGPVSLDGRACAGIWTEALGRAVRFDPHDEARLRASMGRTVEGKKLEDFVKTYAMLRGFELETKAEDVARTTALLGRPPTPYATYVRERAAEWLASIRLSA